MQQLEEVTSTSSEERKRNEEEEEEEGEEGGSSDLDTDSDSQPGERIVLYPINAATNQ
jgi:hypothetical protein